MRFFSPLCWREAYGQHYVCFCVHLARNSTHSGEITTMKRSIRLRLAVCCAVAFTISSAACSGTPTTPVAVQTGPRHDGGITLGSGNFVQQQASADSAARGGITLGSGN